MKEVLRKGLVGEDWGSDGDSVVFRVNNSSEWINRRNDLTFEVLCVIHKEVRHQTTYVRHVLPFRSGSRSSMLRKGGGLRPV